MDVEIWRYACCVKLLNKSVVLYALSHRIVYRVIYVALTMAHDVI